MRRANKMLRRFVDDEQGTIAIFSVYMFVIIVVMTGIAVDIMRFESVRTKMQNTMDRAVLAAADLDQERDPELVVIDYMNAAGIGQTLADVIVDDGLNYRTVTAHGSTSVQTIFTKMVGPDSMTAQATSAAEEKIANVEVSLVLDISGSMGGDRIVNMRSAAKEFVDTVIQDEDSSGLTTVSIVPYNATVSVGETLSPYFNIVETHDYSACPILPITAFNSVPLNLTVPMDRIGHFDPYNSSQSTSEIASPWCPTGDESAIVIHSANTSQLKTFIDSLDAGGNTAIDLGMKWGVALLDETMNAVVSEMAEDGLIIADAADRPAAFSDPEVIKFAVVMTDGQNTTQFDLRSHLKSGWSNVWVDERDNNNPSDDRFSVLVRDWSGTSNDRYFWERYRNSSSSYRYQNSIDGGSDARRMTNAELYARFATAAVANKFWYRPYQDNYISWNTYVDIYNAYEGIVSGSEGDARLSDICAAAREEGIVVFAIGFEAPSAGQDAMLDCASSPSHYFDVSGVEITETFHAIARQINSLRLIQ